MPSKQELVNAIVRAQEWAVEERRGGCSVWLSPDGELSIWGYVEDSLQHATYMEGLHSEAVCIWGTPDIDDVDYDADGNPVHCYNDGPWDLDYAKELWADRADVWADCFLASEKKDRNRTNEQEQAVKEWLTKLNNQPDD